MAMVKAKATEMTAIVARNSALRRKRLTILICNGLRSVTAVTLSVASVALFQSTASAQYAASSAPAGTGQYGLRVQPSLSVSTIYSDNVALAAPGSERSELTTRIAPSLTVAENGPRLRINATYSPNFLYRLNEGTNDVVHLLSGTANAELVQRLLYLDVRTSVSQLNTTLTGAQADGILNTTSNRTSAKTYGISPYLRRDFGYDASGELRFTHDAVSFGANSNGTSASTSDRINAQIASGPSFQLFNWGLAYSKARTEYTQTGQKINSDNISATGGRLIVPSLRLNANVGYENTGYSPAVNGSAAKGTFWSIGPTWIPSPVTKFSATIGRHYYGQSKALHFDHRSRLTTWAIDYSESAGTSRSTLTIPVTQSTATYLDAIFPQSPDVSPSQRQEAIQNFIRDNGLPASLSQPINFLTDALYLDKRWQATFGIQGIRNTVLSSFFSSNRRSLTSNTSTAGDFNVSQSIKQTGANITWSTRLTQTLAANTTLGVTRNEFVSTGSVNRLSFVKVGFTEQFGPKATGTLLLGRLKNNSNAVGGGSATENSVSATLGLRF